MNPLSSENIIQHATWKSLILDGNTVIQIQAILSPLVQKLWNAKSIQEIYDNFNKNVLVTETPLELIQLKQTTEQGKFQELIFEEVNILLESLFNVVKSYTSNKNININDIYSAIFTIDQFSIGATGWSLTLNLFDISKTKIFKKINDNEVTRYVEENITNQFIDKILGQVHPDTKMFVGGYDLIRKILSSDSLRKLHFMNNNHIQTEILIILPGKLGEHASSEWSKAIFKYRRSKSVDISANQYTPEELNIGIFSLYEYLLAEILELSGYIAKETYGEINTFCILESILSDKELNMVFN